MNILISQKIGIDQHGTVIDLLESNYINYFSGFGFKMFPIPNFCLDLSHFFELKIDGIILTGGNDVEESNDYIGLRNNQEKKLIQFAMGKNTPLFCICRGMQLIHHNFGGKLKKIDNHVACVHALHLTKDLPMTKNIQGDPAVNSYHGFAIDEKTISPEFDIFARTEDGVIEGIFHKKLSILAIQWHPERSKLPQDDEFNKNLINSFFCGDAK